MAKRIPGRGETLAYYIKIVGTGERQAEDLTREEAAEAMDLVLSGKATPAQTGAFLLALRMKGESGPEVAGFAEAARRHCPPLAAPPETLDTADYAGRVREPFLSLAADFIAAAAGVPIVRHGNGAAPEFMGRRSIFDTLRALGVEAGPRPGATLQFIHVSQVCPALDGLLHLRRELGVRSVAHVVARLLNPSGAKAHLLGIAHRPTLELMAHALRDSGARRALLVDGVAGSEEMALDAEAGVCEVRARPSTHPVDVSKHEGRGPRGEVRNYRMGPKTFGLKGGPVEPVKSAAEDAALLESILKGGTHGPPRDGALLNGALRLWVAGRAADEAEALRRAREALDSGKAFSLLQELRGR